MEDESHFCRLCLTSSVVYYSLLKNNGKEMVSSLTGIEISADDPYSTESCAKCWLDLKLAYHIQQCFVEAEKKIQQTSFHEELKTEIKDEDEYAAECTTEPPTAEPENQSTEYNFEERNTCDTPEENQSTEYIFEEGNSCDTPEDNDNITDDDTEYPELIYIETDNNVEKEEKLCSCFICGKGYKDETELYSHINIHYSAPQSCDQCLEDLPNISAFRDHIQVKHPELFGKTFVCGICSVSFKYLSLYNLHLGAVHPETAKKSKRKREIKKKINVDLNKPEADNTTSTMYQCNECDKTFIHKKTLAAHCQNHVKKLCPICGLSITSYNINKHIASHETEEVMCDLCGITCKHRESLRWHMDYNHSGKRITCQECGQIFKKPYTYKVHLKKHAGERTYTCETCGKQFFTQHRLNIHIKTTHLKQRNHICKFCNKAFSKRDAMRTHERKHTNEEPYICEICGEGFRQNVSLRAHRTSKHNIIEQKNVECPICSKMFKDLWALQSHTRSRHD